jgi:hypothetical protein
MIIIYIIIYVCLGTLISTLLEHYKIITIYNNFGTFLCITFWPILLFAILVIGLYTVMKLMFGWK